MEKRRLGKTELMVTPLSFGALPVQRCDKEEAHRVLTAVLDTGINFIDTARAYTDSEEKIGESISHRRKEYILATKSMARDYDGMMKDIEISLQTMKTDYIDLYQIHNIRMPADREKVLAHGGALEALQDAQKQGKIGHIGVTGHNGDVLEELVKTRMFSTVQAPFNTVERQVREKLLPWIRSLDMGFIVMKPLGGGVLEHAELALRFVLSHEEAVAIPGMDTVEQVKENIKAMTEYRPLTEEEKAILDEEVQRVGADFCRRCGYCLPCPEGLEIPTMFIFHHQYVRYGMKNVIPGRYAGLKMKASACTECGACETKCPYNLPIRRRLKKVAEDLG